MSNDIHALSGAYALDALDPAERAEFEKHLAGCATCRAEIESLRETAAGLAGLAETSPPPGLRDRVLADAAVVRPLPPAVDRARRRRRWGALVAAAAALVLVGAGVAWHPWDRPSSSVVVSAVDRIAQAPDAQRSTQTLADGGTVTVYRSARLDKAAVVVADLATLPEGKVYEMWLQDAAGTMAPAGVIPPGVGTTEMVLAGSAARAVGAGMTVEPTGGSPAPTSDPVALLSFGKV
ncbi:anti-sigma factor [Nocardioides sp. CER19]|uniref:anti-sigma factor n=1 Tax=Nocardioides sp. CER19 TaxID=3038538 RepID=UPI00244B83A9|nr:anti-sigma factor [Nocardioides sp. CER19]MDH2414679.1 anti-sigma factor [Nocardioides sp. CER19]